MRQTQTSWVDQKQPTEPLSADAETISVSPQSGRAEVEAVSRSRRSSGTLPSTNTQQKERHMRREWDRKTDKVSQQQLVSALKLKLCCNSPCLNPTHCPPLHLVLYAAFPPLFVCNIVVKVSLYVYTFYLVLTKTIIQSAWLLTDQGLCFVLLIVIYCGIFHC